jgi:type IV secretory pathway VirB4 component
VNNLLMQMYAKNRTKIFMIDKGASYRALCEAVNGSYIALALEKDNEGAAPVCINPFYVPTTTSGERRKPEFSELFFMQRVILSMIMNGSGGTTGIDVDMNKEDSTLLLRVLREMFDNNAGNEEVTLSDYVRLLSTYNGENERGAILSSKLYEFTKEGIYGALFDGPLGVDWDADMVVVETDKLDGTPVMGLIMMTLFYQINLYCKYKLPRSRQKIIGIDEAWAALSDPTGEIPRMVSGFYREMRKYLCAVMLISQDITTFVSLVGSEGASSGILGNTRHFFMLSASTADLELAETKLGFTKNEVECWKKTSSLPPFYSEIFYRMITKTDQSYSGRFRLMSNPVALWIATTQPNDVDMKRETIGKYLKQTNDNRMEATRLALVELAKEYPYGSQYKRAA